ncbi:phosphate regulon transcriptional regulator PhoB [Wenzhouxiangella marina]|uniref:Phosphate regulon transcriptional regulatory protein PhoB n=1 Tax=Wenzhouxiangella marina TaxID=1579979 RepID=A0A0K0XX38_9GAMM|nr:phosphate regulon transcriptional regulator PhoB [Wenzhouxiangella marina]AKS42235.1 Chemotaxis protein CheY [Wenzhouxiangella marina]MBB6085993.1 two-component system phosphate regulon response regulator PhoB [Wenzhouxiangella marina]
MSERRILVVEDDEGIRKMIAFNLERAGFDVVEAADCHEGRVAVSDQRPDLILLDWMLPDQSGPEFARSMRRDEMTGEIPIIMLTARSLEDDKVRGFESGIDDYITKPFASRELIARIKAVMRRTSPAGRDDEVEAEGLVLNVASHRVLANGEPVDLGPTEFRMLRFFMTHQDRVYSRAQLLDQVWGGGVYVEERTVDVHILRLRKALAKHGFDKFVQTVRGAGYRFSVTGAS